MIAASLQATAAVARFKPRRFATETPRRAGETTFGYGSSEPIASLQPPLALTTIQP